MAISMAKTIKEERLRWVKPIAEKRVKLVNVSKVCPHSKRSLERWVDEQTNHHSICFLKEVMRRFDYPIAAIKTDNHATFTNRYNGSYKREDLSPRQMHALDQFCAAHNIVHYLIDPGKPAQNGTVERSHREDQEKFYEQNGFKNLDDLERKLKVWNTYYNNLEHCGLGGKTPNEFLEDYKLIKPPYVLA